MHEVAFVLKQSHLAVLERLRPMAAPHELTPARFDLLYVVQRFRRFGGAPTESDLAHALEVSRATVCKMLRALVELGFVTLSVCEKDRRRRRVHFTVEGRRRFRAVLRLARHRHVDAAIRSAYIGRIPPDGGFGRWLRVIVQQLQVYLDGVRRRGRLYGYGGYVPSPAR